MDNEKKEARQILVAERRILLADDSISIRKVVELTFAAEGFDVTTVGDGDAAMQKFVEIQPDIVLVDVNMPGPNGYQICEMIKQDESTRSIPVVLLVGSFEPFDQAEAERVGADGFLTKPFYSIRNLVTKVDELLGINLSETTAGPAAETSDIDSLYKNSFAETVRVTDENPADEFLGDVGMDDEMIEASYPADAPNDAGTAFFLPETDAVQPTDPFESVAGDVKLANGESSREPNFGPRFVYEDAELAGLMDPVVDKPAAENEQQTEEAVHNETHQDDLSAEFITLVAQKVVEKLSDKTIREIAQEAIPRIAEKLIREALEEDKKA